MQNQGDVVGRGRYNWDAFWGINNAHVAVLIHIHCVYGDVQVLGGATCFFGAIGRSQQNFCRRVVEIKGEFLKAVSGIQRRSGPGKGSGKERDDGRQAVWQDVGYAFSPLDADSGQGLSHGLYLAAERVIRYGGASLRNND